MDQIKVIAQARCRLIDAFTMTCFAQSGNILAHGKVNEPVAHGAVQSSILSILLNPINRFAKASTAAVKAIYTTDKAASVGSANSRT